MTRTTVDVFSDLASKSQNGIRKLADSINKTVDESLQFSPVITPMLDLDGVNKTVSSFAPNYGMSLDGFDTAADKARRGYVDGTVSGTVVQYYQTNMSPKALSAEEIYRQTSSLMARLKNRG
jgi:hypothetical protein